MNWLANDVRNDSISFIYLYDLWNSEKEMSVIKLNNDSLVRIAAKVAFRRWISYIIAMLGFQFVYICISKSIARHCLVDRRNGRR